MPRFAANLGYLFTERPLIERFGAAAAAGFRAVELQFVYDHAPSALRAEIDRHNLTVLGVNTAPGRSAPGQLASGEFGVAAIPGREAEFAAVFRQALDYIVALGGCQIHCLAGKVPPEQRPAAEATFVRNLTRGRGPRGRQEHHAADRADQSARPAGLFPQPGRARRRHHRQGRPPECAHPVRLLSCADCRRRSDPPVREASSRWSATSRSPRCRSRHEPDEGEVNYPAIFEMLDRLGYAGWVGCEYRPRARTEAGLAWARPYGVVPPG